MKKLFTILIFIAALNVKAQTVNLITNGSFEDTPWWNAWGCTGNCNYQWGGAGICLPSNGFNYMWFGDSSEIDNQSFFLVDETINQSVTIPLNTIGCTLSWDVSTYNTSFVVETLEIYLKSSTMGILGHPATLTAPAFNWVDCSGWNHGTFVIPSNLFGLTFDVWFETIFNITGDVVCFRLDNIRLDCTLNTTSVDEIKNPVSNFILSPNPVASKSTIAFTLSQSENVSLKVYDIVGKEVKTIVKDYLAQGYHEFIWNATDDSDNLLENGMYFVRVETINYAVSKKLFLLR